MFGDVRMTPCHIEDLVTLRTQFLPSSRHGPTALELEYRIFCVLFWLAQGVASG